MSRCPVVPIRTESPNSKIDVKVSLSFLSFLHCLVSFPKKGKI
ncbi:hypothetical protein LEP1GSC060_0894 [Leptospira weilii serovar Ranarum str. ICFT]|uniref:Uncharacterized protein n=1 Tax=Leptospira weilii serovar Ranarum str. ICFT TaxID=1218598 RepID=N1WR63_9LEPT|nr:hypothetical protein LEP1GSC060_0894 [Leptospira weilii serovar Ranarum str. ICFT]